ncbi:MAG: ABC transporter ATP-binding protein [Thermodesulfobacteriota bacterium]|nr:ABC transporter ATP-binding protein [Thermodesulfobacteriota bacterium]
MSQYLLRVTHLTKDFGGVRAINDVSFELEEGSFLGIIGPNGSGKTTLVNLITGFIRSDSGKIFYRGRDITRLMPYTIANLGIVRSFQMAKPFSRLPAFKNLIIPLCSPRVMKQMRGGKYGRRDDVAIDFLEEVGFERDSHVPYQMAGSLPHGYIKRMELASCMAMRPDLLILDELFSGMSMSEVASTLPIIEKLREEGKTIIMIEHRLKELFRVADRVMVMNFGIKIADGSSREVMNGDEVRKAYLGSEIEAE